VIKVNKSVAFKYIDGQYTPNSNGNTPTGDRTMIEDSYGMNRMTPKEKAQEVIAHKLHAVYHEDNWKESGMTRREIDLIMDQILKIIPGIEKSLGGKEYLS